MNGDMNDIAILNQTIQSLKEMIRDTEDHLVRDKELLRVLEKAYTSLLKESMTEETVADILRKGRGSRNSDNPLKSFPR